MKPAVLLILLQIVPTPPPIPDIDPRPNILVILTDDQRAQGSVIPGVMPETRQRFVNQGTKFANAFATTPLCCPSRASIFTGQYAHNTGVRLTEDALDHRNTLQRYLHEAGYQTGIVGKFLNSWDYRNDPPHFDRFTLIDRGGFNHDANRDGQIVHLKGYHNTVVLREALSILSSFEDRPAPWALFVHVFSPHAPYIPEPRYDKANVPPWNGNPSIPEKDRSDKPPYVQNRNPVSFQVARQIRNNQLRMLMSVDDLVGRLFDSLGEHQALSDTLSFYLSDNGLLHGDHGLVGKVVPYLPSVEIPFYVRWPGHFEADNRDSRLVANIDLAPTVYDALNIFPGYTVDGRSLLRPYSRDHLLLESWDHTMNIPTWKMYLDRRETYVKYGGGKVVFREHYHIGRDPWQLRNVALGPITPHERDMAIQINRDQDCAGEMCP
jgi:arylsulfatase A-like enzyme